MAAYLTKGDKPGTDNNWDAFSLSPFLWIFQFSDALSIYIFLLIRNHSYNIPLSL